MKVSRISIDRSPLNSTDVRLSGKLSLSAGADDIGIWFDIDETLVDGFATSGAPWLLAMLPYGFEFGGTLELDIPVDALLVENLIALGHTYRMWYPHLKPFDIQVDRQILVTGAEKAASFFSGGIDATYTALRHLPLSGSDQVGSIDELLMIWGFDIELEAAAEFQRLRAAGDAFADKTGVPLRVMATNLRRPKTFWTRAWGPLCHSIGRAACAHALENRYKKMVWGSNFRVDQAYPEGSHPLSDQYYSSSNLEILLDGAARKRIDKVDFLARYPWAVENAHVCYDNLDSKNCGKCSKCVRSMIAFDLTGLSATCKSLDRPTPNLIKSTYCGDQAERIFFEELFEYANRVERADLSEALDKALRRSRRLRPMMNAAKWMQTKAMIWRLGRAIRNSIVPAS